GLALGQPGAAVLLVDRAGERVIGARRDRVAQRFRLGLHFGRYRVGDIADQNLAAGDAFPGIDLFIAAVQQGAHALDVVGAPVVDDRGDARAVLVFGHVGRLPKADHTRGSRRPGQRRGRVGAGGDRGPAPGAPRLGRV